MFFFLGASVCVGVHLFRSGRLLWNLDAKVRVFLVIGGTDVNEHVEVAEKMFEMERAVKRAECVVCFTNVLCRRFKDLFRPKCKTVTIFPSVFVAPDRSPSMLDLSLFDDPFFLLPCGIREVKRPAMLLDAIEVKIFWGLARKVKLFVVLQDLAAEKLFICGPVLSQSCFAEFSAALKGERDRKPPS